MRPNTAIAEKLRFPQNVPIPVFANATDNNSDGDLHDCTPSPLRLSARLHAPRK